MVNLDVRKSEILVPTNDYFRCQKIINLRVKNIIELKNKILDVKK